eukprot:scaffold7307_cov125-Isochrysis_galbana.AAC.4
MPPPGPAYAGCIRVKRRRGGARKRARRRGVQSRKSHLWCRPCASCTSRKVNANSNFNVGAPPIFAPPFLVLRDRDALGHQRQTTPSTPSVPRH